MLIEFTVGNFRSFREKQVLTLVPDESKGENIENIFEGEKGYKLLTSSIIYGANASGKSNLIRAMQSLRSMILFSSDKQPEKMFKEYDPFKFQLDSAKKPVEFGVMFLLHGTQYRYQVKFSENEVLYEALFFYPQGREAKLFNRIQQKFEFGEYLKGQKSVIAELTANNQLFLSKAATNNLEQLVEVFTFFNKDFMTIPFLDKSIDNWYTERIAKELLKTKGNEIFTRNFKTLLKGFDTGVVDFKIDIEEDHFGDDIYEISIEHNIYDAHSEVVGTKWHPFIEESVGTQKLFILGALIVRALMNGRVIIVDEFERSLHPLITTFILQVFHEPKINAQGAQLVIATHDTTLLSHSQLRRDQIWIVEKDLQGCSELFSLADMNGVRADIPFEKWYLSGRFGGIPGIEKLNFELNFQNEAFQKQEEETNQKEDSVPSSINSSQNMQLQIHPVQLQLREAFTISHGSRTVQPSMIVALSQEGHTGYGEATATSYYGLTLEQMVEKTETLRVVIEKTELSTPEVLWNELQPLLKDDPFIHCALDEAAHDLYGRLQGKPLYQLWGLSDQNLPLTNYTIGIGTIEEMVAKIKRYPWPVYKIKLGTDHDLEIIEHLRQETDAIFRVDANTAWTAEQTVDLAPKFKALGVEFLEQPLSAGDWEGMKYVYKHSALPIIADESCQREEDVARCLGHFHGVNIKLMKCGGITPARRMIEQARKLGLQVMIGCMTESSVGISAIGQLLPLLDYVDMDGALLLSNDPAEGVKIENGQVFLSEKPGTGVELKL